MLLDEIREIIADVLEINMEDIDIDSRLDDLGVDSLAAIDITSEVEDQYSIEISDDTIKSFKTVEDIVSYVEANLD